MENENLKIARSKSLNNLHQEKNRYKNSISLKNFIINKLFYDEKTDFYTSASLSKPLWGKLLIESCISLLEDRNPEDFSFVEIGAEPESNSLANEEHPFKEIKTIRLGEKLEIPPNAIVFSNEWLDAQPFKRFRFDEESKQWHEIGVRIESETGKDHHFNQTFRKLSGAMHYC